MTVTQELTQVSINSEITLQATQDAMQAMIINGKRPNVKLAFWISACSIQCSVDENMYRASIMRTYIDRPLPTNREVLRAELNNPFNTIVNTMYAIEQLYNVGIIHMNTGTTFESQSAWRKSMVAAIPGMGYKTVSFALHIYNPFGCELLTIDRWHIRRLASRCGITKDSLTPKQYLCLEAELLDDCRLMATCESETQGKKYAPIVLAACLWERTRKAEYALHPNPLHKIHEGYQDHSGLSCYV